MKLAELAQKLNSGPINPQDLKEFSKLLIEVRQLSSALLVLKYLYQTEKNVINLISLCKVMVDIGSTENLDMAIGMINRELNNLSNSQEDLFELRKIIGNAYTKKGDFEKARMYYDSCVRMNRELDTIYTNLGVLYYTHGIFEQAGEFFQKAIEIRMDNSAALTGLGMTLMENGRPGLALIRLNQALDYEPANINAINALIRLTNSTGNIGIALKRIRDFLEIEPMNVDMIYSCAALEYQLGNFDITVRELERALLINPEHQYSNELMELVIGATPGTNLANQGVEGKI